MGIRRKNSAKLKTQIILDILKGEEFDIFQ
jgi:hypothetical protein